MTMLEKAARAVRRRRFERTRRLNIYDETVPPTDNEIDDVRAVLEAIRVPDERMIDAGNKHFCDAIECTCDEAVIFTAMIDHIRAEPTD